MINTTTGFLYLPAYRGPELKNYNQKHIETADKDKGKYNYISISKKVKYFKYMCACAIKI